MRSRRHRFERLLGWALPWLLLGCGVLPLGDSDADLAKRRVASILQAIQDGAEGSSPKIQAAMCRWYADVLVIHDLGTMELALDGFDQWRVEGNIWRVSSFEIAEKTEGAGPQDPSETTYVHAKINGTWHWLRVPPKQPISWAD